VETIHVELAYKGAEVTMFEPSAENFVCKALVIQNCLLGWLINDSLLNLVEMRCKGWIRTEERISSIRPTNKFNITGVIYHSIEEKKRKEVIR
jgi:hypothetical protein